MLIFVLILDAKAANASDLKRLKIGIAANMSEVSLVDCNPFGTSFQEGIYLALEANQNLLRSLNLELEIVPFDYGAQTEKVIEMAIQAAKSEVAAVIGYTCSTHALLAAPIHNKFHLPMITPSATANRLSKMGGYVHSGCFNNEFMAHTLAEIAHAELDSKKVLTVAASDCAYCQDLAHAFSEAYNTYHDSKYLSFSVFQTDNTFPDLVKYIRKNEPDVIFLPNQEILSTKIIKEILTSKIDIKFLGADGWGNSGQNFFEMIEGCDINGFAVAHWHTSLKDEKSQKFIRKYKKEYGRLPNDTSVLAYDTLSMFIHALRGVETYDRNGIQNALKRKRQYNGVTGKFIYSTGGGYPKKSLVLLRLHSKAFNVVKRIDPTS